MAGSHAPRPRKNKDTLHNEDWLKTKYLDEKMNANEIARLLGCSGPSVVFALKKFGIPRRSMAEGKRGRPSTTVWTPEMRESLAAQRRGELNPMHGTVSPWAGHHTEGVVRTRHRGRTEAARLIPSQPCETCGEIKSERHHVSGNPADNRPENIRFFCRKHHLEIGHGGHFGNLVVPAGHIDDRASAPAKTIRPPLSEERKAELREIRRQAGLKVMTPEHAREMALRGQAVKPLTTEQASEMSAKAAARRIQDAGLRAAASERMREVWRKAKM